MFSSKRQKKKGLLSSLSGMFGLFVLVVLVAGAAAAFMLTGKSQELRQQAAGENCGQFHHNEQGCRYSGRGCVWQASGYSCSDPTHQAACAAGSLPGCTFRVNGSCTGTATQCDRIIIDVNNITPCTNQLGCQPQIINGRWLCRGTAESCGNLSGDAAVCRRQKDCTYSSTESCTGTPGVCMDPVGSSPNPSSCTPGSPDFCQNPGVTSYQCKCVAVTGGNAWNCNTVNTTACPVGGGTGGTGGGGTGGGGTGGGGTGGGGTTTIPTGPRSISGTVRCEAPINGHPTLGTAYPITGLSVQVYEGSLDAPGAVLGTTTTAADGRYTVSNFVLPQGKTRFSVVPSRLTLRDASFVPSGSPDLGCTQGVGYSLCNALNLPIGQTRGNFNFKTTAKASTLGGRNLDGTANYEFSFTMAKDTTGAYIQRYLVKLDRQESPKVWAPGNNTTSDYALYVPSSVGTCSQATGRCTITKAQINSKNAVQMKDGQYTMTISPISASTPGGVAAVELCRNEAYLSVPVRVCGSGLSCVGYFGVQGAQHCLNNNGAPMYCCPAGKTVQGTRCN